jgi:23S rRNA (cytidine1920-2'-O)/16S rRNA (cytidine1409-2'-O)-methyltransferase
MTGERIVGRAGEKLCFALKHFKIPIKGKTCADFGSAVGGFVDCLLEFGADKVYAVETGYGVLDWRLRSDSRVVVMERTNAMHVDLPEKVDFISIDVSWTKQARVLPNALRQLKEEGEIVSLIKPHYEAGPKFLRKGRLPDDLAEEIFKKTLEEIKALGVLVRGAVVSPILGGKAQNREYLVWLAAA